MLSNKLKTVAAAWSLLIVGTLLYIGPTQVEAQGKSDKAKADKAQENVVVTKEDKKKSGKVGFINSKFISIIDETKSQPGYEFEQLMYVDEAVEVRSKNDLSEIKVGDTVQVDYEEMKKTSTEGEKKKDVAKSVKFLKAADTEDSSLKSGKK